MTDRSLVLCVGRGGYRAPGSLGAWPPPAHRQGHYPQAHRRGWPAGPIQHACLCRKEARRPRRAVVSAHTRSILSPCDTRSIMLKNALRTAGSALRTGVLSRASLAPTPFTLQVRPLSAFHRRARARPRITASHVVHCLWLHIHWKVKPLTGRNPIDRMLQTVVS